jgi:origin recognition complex subunit 3
MLSSFKTHVNDILEAKEYNRFYGLLEDDDVLREEVDMSLSNRPILSLLRVMFLVATLSPEPASSIDLYVTTFEGTLGESEFVSRILDSTKRMMPEGLATFLQKVRDTIHTGSLELDLDGWAAEDADFLEETTRFQSQASNLAEQASSTGKPIRSSHAIRSQGVRTTVIAQRVQLSYEESTLSQQDKEYTVLVDKVNELLKDYFSVQSPQDMFLHELWLYDSMSPYREVFTPKPRAAIERALSAPYDYLRCDCCDPVEGLSSTHPATAILYQMYLETGSLINVFDLWSAFFEMASGGEEQRMDEKDALVLFYKALADLKSLGMIKQSKKKADHLAKTTWKGL